MKSIIFLALLLGLSGCYQRKPDEKYKCEISFYHHHYVLRDGEWVFIRNVGGERATRYLKEDESD